MISHFTRKIKIHEKRTSTTLHHHPHPFVCVCPRVLRPLLVAQDEHSVAVEVPCPPLKYQMPSRGHHPNDSASLSIISMDHQYRNTSYNFSILKQTNKQPLSTLLLSPNSPCFSAALYSKIPLRSPLCSLIPIPLLPCPLELRHLPTISLVKVTSGLHTARSISALLLPHHGHSLLLEYSCGSSLLLSLFAD